MNHLLIFLPSKTMLRAGIVTMPDRSIAPNPVNSLTRLSLGSV